MGRQLPDELTTRQMVAFAKYMQTLSGMSMSDLTFQQTDVLAASYAIEAAGKAKWLDEPVSVDDLPLSEMLDFGMKILALYWQTWQAAKTDPNS